jgi:Spy/CpxP family protein refolding chaperone
MRIVRLILVATAALATAAASLAAPALARNSNIQKNDDKPAAPPSCHAYQQAADGSWTQLPCQEGSQGQTQRRSAAKAPDDDTR